MKKQSKWNKMLKLQRAKAWDMEEDIDWSKHDFSKPQLPIGSRLSRVLNLTDDEKLALSQFLGLMAIQAISQHEKAIANVKEYCWKNPSQRENLSHDLRKLGEQFFDEEAKHSKVFEQYIVKFSSCKNIDSKSLLKILPKYSNSFMSWLYKCNSFFGGRSIWWLVMLTEEESIDLYRQLRPVKSEVDPLYYQLHKLHFEEEIRHISYAPLMLRNLGYKKNIFSRCLQKFDYIFAEFLHFLWILLQLKRINNVREFRDDHQFFNDIDSLIHKINSLPFFTKWKLILSDFPFISNLFKPLRHKAMRIELKRNSDYSSIFRRYAQ